MEKLINKEESEIKLERIETEEYIEFYCAYMQIRRERHKSHFFIPQFPLTYY